MPLDTISLEETPSDWRVPGTSIEVRPAWLMLARKVTSSPTLIGSLNTT